MDTLAERRLAGYARRIGRLKTEESYALLVRNYRRAAACATERSFEEVGYQAAKAQKIVREA